MATAALTPVEEYLPSSWDPDREYVDGVVLERNWGDLPHSYLQGMIWGLFDARGLHAFVELRTEARPRRFRIPDVLAMREAPKSRFVRTPPLIVVEILSPEDRVSELGSRVFTGAIETSDGSVSITLEEIFGGMPELESE